MIWGLYTGLKESQCLGWGLDVQFKQTAHEFVVHINIAELLNQCELTNTPWIYLDLELQRPELRKGLWLAHSPLLSSLVIPMGIPCDACLEFRQLSNAQFTMVVTSREHSFYIRHTVPKQAFHTLSHLILKTILRGRHYSICYWGAESCGWTQDLQKPKLRCETTWLRLDYSLSMPPWQFSLSFITERHFNCWLTYLFLFRWVSWQ